MMRRLLQRLIASCMAAVLVVGISPAVSLAAVIKYDLPTSATSLTHTATDEDGNTYTYRHVTTAATMYAEFNVEMLGISDLESNPKTVVSTWDAAQANSKAGIVASNANMQPDEYLANYYYNIYANDHGLLPASDEATTYVTRWDSSSASADTDNLWYSVYRGADIQFATQASVASQIEQKNAGKQAGDDGYYDPIICAPGTGTTAKMVDGEYRLANAVDQTVLKSVDKNGNYTVQGRYKEDASTYEIADDFAKVAYGTQYYVLQQIAQGKTTKKTVAVVSDYDSASQTYSIMNLDKNLGEIRGTGYAGHLAAGIQNTVNDFADTLGAVDDGTEQYVTDVTAEQLAKADCVLFSDYFSDTQYSNSQQLGKDEAVSELKKAMGDNADGRILANYPGLVFNFLYASSAESIFNYAIAQSFVYSDVLDFTDMMAYWYSKINHVKDSSLQDMVDTLCADVSLPKGMSSIGTTSAADVETIDAQLEAGMNYYEANKDALVKDAPQLEKPTSTTLGVGRTQIDDQTYTGKAIEPAVEVYTITGDKVASSNYTVSYANNTELGCASVTVTAKDDSEYAGQSFTTYFKITERGIVDLSNASITIPETSYTYTGNAIEPNVTVKVNGEVVAANNYEVSYRSNTSVGTATVTVTGILENGYKNSAHVAFTILKAPQAIKVKPASKVVKAAKVNNKAKTYTFTVTGNKADLQVASLSKSAKKGISKVKISGNNVKVTVKKGANKGTYKVKVCAKSGANYEASSYKSITIKVK